MTLSQPKPEPLMLLVDQWDRPVGVGTKTEVHVRGKLHRAFSIFVFNGRGQLLLQRRAVGKYHSGGLWANTCCGHPRPDEPVDQAAARRLGEEMGFRCRLQKMFHFTYRAPVGDGLTEHEFDHVFVGRHEGEISPAECEVMDYQWVSLEEALHSLEKSPERYAVWYRLALPQLAERLRDGLWPEWGGGSGSAQR